MSTTPERDRPLIVPLPDPVAAPTAPAAGVGATVPTPVTSLLGREAEVAGLADLLLGEARLVTLTGPGGVGKTRVATAVAQRLVTTTTLPVGFVSLAPIASADPDLIAGAIALGLGLRLGPDQAPARALLAALDSRPRVLVLDNFEHLLPVAPLVSQLLAASPTLRVLTTSRGRLHLSGERVVPVAPLPIPAPELTADLAASPAVQLFAERAAAADPGFALDAGNLKAVAEICRRLDGLPLAIESAAARIALLSPVALLARLDPLLPVLTDGPRDLPARLRTMHDAITWSYDLATPDSQRLLHRLAVFAGGFPLAAAERLPGANPQAPGAPPVSADVPRRAAPPLLDLIAELVDGGLLQRQAGADDEPRFWLLQTIREFGLDRLRDANEEGPARTDHAAWYLALVEATPAESEQARQERFEVEHDNLRAALDWTIGRGEAETALRLAAGLRRFWTDRGHWTEGRSWLERAIALPGAEAGQARAAALAGLGAIAGDQGDFADAARHLEASLALCQSLGDAVGTARALRGLGIIASNQSDFAAAAAQFEQALAAFRAADEQTGVARCLNDLGLIASRQGKQDRAIAYEEEALRVARDVGDDQFVCLVLGNLGGAYYDRGDYDRGSAITEEALALSQRLGDSFGIAVNLYNLGNYLLKRGESAPASERFRQALAVCQELGERHLASRVLDRYASVLVVLGEPRLAVRLFGAAAAARTAIGDQLFAEEAANIDEHRQAAQRHLGEPAAAAAWAAGQAMSLEQAIAEVLTRPPETAPAISATAPATAPGGPRATAEGRLSPRETEVLRLVADGQSDIEIAAALYISRPTASRHVANILAKLAVPSRAAAAALAVREGLI